MKYYTKNTTLSLIVIFLLFMASCRKASTEVLEKTALKKVGSEFIENVSKKSFKEISELGLSKEATDFVIKNFDDDLTKQFLKIASENRNFLNTVKRNPKFIDTWKIFAETNFGSKPKQLSWINRELANEKFTLKKVGQKVEILDSKTNKLLGTFEKDKLVANAGKGGKNLNPILNIHPLIPNTHIKTGQSSTYSDGLGRVEKMVCPLLTKEIKVERSVIEQGLSKKIKNGLEEIDELGNPIKVKAGYSKYKDDGGHLLANMFGGSSEQINYLPMSNEANKKSFKKLETYLSKCIDEGKEVSEFTVIPKYKGKIGRPDKFYISYYVDGKHFSQKIMNH
jgi:hypothetical protein